MTRKAIPIQKLILIPVVSILFFTACNNNDTTKTPTMQAIVESSTPEVENTATPTQLSFPTAEPGVPLAAIVNGQGITLEELQAEVELSQAASGTGLINFTKEEVLQNLIDEVLLAQGAAETGFIPDNVLITTRFEELGIGEEALQEWINQNGYTQEVFERAIYRSIAAAWMRDQIISGLDSTSEQVHARQILLYNSENANNIYSQLQSGTDFATLAVQNDPVASGDLGWFPRGYLTVPELDDPIFSLQPGAYTDIIETKLGFHIIQVVDRDPNKPLSPGALQTLKVQAVRNWVIERRNQSDIEIISS